MKFAFCGDPLPSSLPPAAICMHGVAYIRGAVKVMKGGPQDAKAEVELIAKILRLARTGIKDVVIDCAFRT